MLGNSVYAKFTWLNRESNSNLNRKQHQNVNLRVFHILQDSSYPLVVRSVVLYVLHISYRLLTPSPTLFSGVYYCIPGSLFLCLYVAFPGYLQSTRSRRLTVCDMRLEERCSKCTSKLFIKVLGLIIWISTIKHHPQNNLISQKSKKGSII